MLCIISFLFVCIRLNLGDIIVLGAIPYAVIGTARHRIWLQSTARNENENEKKSNKENENKNKNNITADSRKSSSSLLFPVIPKTTTLKGKEVVKDPFQNMRQNNNQDQNLNENLSKNFTENFKEFVGLTRTSLDHFLLLENNEKIRSKEDIMRKGNNETKNIDEKSNMRRTSFDQFNSYSSVFPLFSSNIKNKNDKKTNTRKNNNFGKWNFTDSSAMVNKIVMKYQDNFWRRDEDEVLILWLETIGKQSRESPLNIDYQTLKNKREAVINLSELKTDKKENFTTHKDRLSISARIKNMYVRHTDEDIEVRTLLLIHMNDLLSPFLPLLAPVDGSKVHIGGKNHPTQLLLSIRSLVFLPVISEFTYKICNIHSKVRTNDNTTQERTVSTVNANVGGKISIQIPGQSSPQAQGFLPSTSPLLPTSLDLSAAAITTATVTATTAATGTISATTTTTFNSFSPNSSPGGAGLFTPVLTLTPGTSPQMSPSGQVLGQGPILGQIPSDVSGSNLLGNIDGLSGERRTPLSIPGLGLGPSKIETQNLNQNQNQNQSASASILGCDNNGEYPHINYPNVLVLFVEEELIMARDISHRLRFNQISSSFSQNGNGLYFDHDEEINENEVILRGHNKDGNSRGKNNDDNYDKHTPPHSHSPSDSSFNTYNPTDNISNLPLFYHENNDNIVCSLLTGIKCSLIGQMMEYFGDLSEGSSGVPGVKSHSENNIENKIKSTKISNSKCVHENGWENILRSSCSRNVLWVENLKFSDNNGLPFIIRKKKCKNIDKSDKINYYDSENNKESQRKDFEKKNGFDEKILIQQTRLFHLLSLSESIEKQNKNIDDRNTKNGVSERTIFTVFVTQALEQVHSKTLNIIPPFFSMFLCT